MLELKFAFFRCEPWEGVLDGTKLKNSPMQSEAMVKGLEPFYPFTNEFNEDINKFDEDCLYLKIYTSNPDAKMPVCSTTHYICILIKNYQLFYCTGDGLVLWWWFPYWN